MNSKAHKFVVNVALACLPQKERYILSPRWGGLDTGATLPDEFNIMWDTSDTVKRHLVHRYYIDSDDEKSRGCVLQSWRYATGSLDYIIDYMNDSPENNPPEDEFLENIGMMLGVLSHHISDLCTPVHVGHKIDCQKLGYKTLSRFHTKVERDIDRYLFSSKIQLHKPKIVNLTKSYFKHIAQDTYNNHFLNIENLYFDKKEEDIQKMVTQILSTSIKHTADVWHTVLTKSNMASRKWSMQPLL